MLRILSLALLIGCTNVHLPPATVPEGSNRVEERKLPPNPEEEALPAGTPKGDWVEPLEAGSCLDEKGKAIAGATQPCPPRPGILSSEARANRDALFRIRYRELRLNYESDRSVWEIQRKLYEKRLQLADQALRDAQPGWFEKNALTIGSVGGFVVGVSITAAIVALLR